MTTFRAHLDDPGSPLTSRPLAESHLQSPFAMEGAGDSDVDILGSQPATLFPHTPRKFHYKKSSRPFASATYLGHDTTQGKTPAPQGGGERPPHPALLGNVQDQIRCLKAKQGW